MDIYKHFIMIWIELTPATGYGIQILLIKTKPAIKKRKMW